VILRPYQSDVYADVLCELAAGTRGILVVMPTGAGKTVFFTKLVQDWPGLAAVVAHRRELIRQASSKLGNTPHGIIAAGFPFARRRIQVSSIQTLARRLERIPIFPIIVADECHHAVAGQWKKLFDAQPDAQIVGVTATPERLDGRGLGRASGGPFDVMIEGPSTAELISDGYLTGARVLAPPPVADLTHVKTLAGEFHPGQVAEAMDKPSVTGDAVQHYLTHARGLPAIAACTSVAHAEHVAEQFRAAGVLSTCVHGALDTDTRDARIGGLADGSVEVLTFCDLISEGVDIPAICCVIMLRPTQSLGLFLQTIGRGLRPMYSPGYDLETRAGRLASIAASHKPRLILIDHVGNTRLRHGLPDDPRVWTLEGRAKRSKTAPAVRQCPACFAAHRPAPACPECGHVYETGGWVGRREVLQVEGELVEFSRGETQPAPAALPRHADAAALAQARTWAQVDAVRVARGVMDSSWTDNAMRWKRRPRRGYTTAAEDFT
jgi:DNA repair protein RadD